MVLGKARFLKMGGGFALVHLKDRWGSMEIWHIDTVRYGMVPHRRDLARLFRLRVSYKEGATENTTDIRELHRDG